MKHSIIVTGYNCDLYVEECINSLLSQTYQSFEILIYNDGSDDKTLEILKKFENNPKIKIFNNKVNRGALFGRFNLNKKKSIYLVLDRIAVLRVVSKL